MPPLKITDGHYAPYRSDEFYEMLIEADRQHYSITHVRAVNAEGVEEQFGLAYPEQKRNLAKAAFELDSGYTIVPAPKQEFGKKILTVLRTLW